MNHKIKHCLIGPGIKHVYVFGLILLSLFFEFSCTSSTMNRRFAAYDINLIKNNENISGCYKVAVYDSMPGIYNLWWLLTEDTYQYQKGMEYKVEISQVNDSPELLDFALKDSTNYTLAIKTKKVTYTNGEWIIKHNFKKIFGT